MAKKYTKYNAEFPYEDQYPDLRELGANLDGQIYVAQGCGRISKDGREIRSDGFSKCSALILKNTKTLESALFHLQEWHLTFEQTPFVDELVRNYVASLGIDQEERDKLQILISAAARYWNRKSFSDETFYDERQREAFRTRMNELNKESVPKVCFVRGDLSLDRKFCVIRDLLGYFGIGDADEILVDTENMHWSMVYKPRESTILADSQKQKKVLSYSF